MSRPLCKRLVQSVHSIGTFARVTDVRTRRVITHVPYALIEFFSSAKSPVVQMEENKDIESGKEKYTILTKHTRLTLPRRNFPPPESTFGSTSMTLSLEWYSRRIEKLISLGNGGKHAMNLISRVRSPICPERSRDFVRSLFWPTPLRSSPINIQHGTNYAKPKYSVADSALIPREGSASLENEEAETGKEEEDDDEDEEQEKRQRARDLNFKTAAKRERVRAIWDN